MLPMQVNHGIAALRFESGVMLLLTHVRSKQLYWYTTGRPAD